MVTCKCMINGGTVTPNASLSWPDFLALLHKNCPSGLSRQHFFFQWKSLSFLWVKHKRQTDKLNSTNAQHAEHYFERTD